VQAPTPEQCGEHGVPCFASDSSALATKLFDTWPPKLVNQLANRVEAQCADFQVRPAHVLQATLVGQEADDFFVCEDRWAK
jgi:hypothetical protein